MAILQKSRGSHINFAASALTGPATIARTRGGSLYDNQVSKPGSGKVSHPGHQRLSSRANFYVRAFRIILLIFSTERFKKDH
jgi:hypothetical protein